MIMEEKKTKQNREEKKIVYYMEPEEKAAYEKLVRESPATYIYHRFHYPRQGEYTVADYLSIPDEHRCELIDGVFYDMGAPTTGHQEIAALLWHQLYHYIRGKNGKCFSFVSPVDVQLDSENRTMVEPDVLVVCDREKLKNGRVYGAPDLVAEVFSPSGKTYDKVTKGNKYRRSGVKEYWMIDPEAQEVTVCLFENEKTKNQKTCTFQDRIPVSIFHGDCVIDFREIWDTAGFLFV